jgi:hypothetical protein
MAIIDDISDDLDWRETEIASMRLLLSKRDLSTKQMQVLLRAAWALLYAHYEGFVKYCLTLFYAEISSRQIFCETLPISTQIFALTNVVKKIRAMSVAGALMELKSFKAKHLDSFASFPEVDTASNLWPEKLIELFESADLKTRVIEENRMKLSTLVARRNQIAHGEKNMIAELDYYRSYEEVVYEIMYDLALQIDGRLSASPYLE